MAVKTARQTNGISLGAGCRVALLYGAVLTTLLVTAALLTPGPGGPEAAAARVPGAALKSIVRQTSTWLHAWAPLASMPQAERLQLLIEENQWKNSLVMWMLPEPLVQALSPLAQSWLRCWILCAAVYFIVGGLWAWYAYACFGDVLFKPNAIPSMGYIWEQIKVSNMSMPLYSLLPACTEYAAEKGWLLAYPRVDNVGLPMYAVFFILYLASVEFGVYWMHRGLHDVKVGYKLLHFIHHKYNKENSMSPFAGLAFHPVDGMLQAIPYTWSLMYCPMHFLTHEILLFATGIWTTNIHDNIHGKVWPIMGAGFHTIHHTTYKHNYGHYFTFVDGMFGTLISPEELEAEMAAEATGTAGSGSSSPSKAASVAAVPTSATLQAAAADVQVHLTSRGKAVKGQ